MKLRFFMKQKHRKRGSQCKLEEVDFLSFCDPGGTKFEPFNCRTETFGKAFGFIKLSNF